MTADTATLEQSLDEDRDHLRETLSVIEDRMSPGRMIDEAMSYFNTGPKAFASVLSEQAKANPLPVLLTGVGLAWLILGDRSGTQGTTPGSSSPETADTAPQDFGEEDFAAWSQHDRIAQFELDCSRLDDEPHDVWQTRLHAGRASALGLAPDAGEDESGFRTRVSLAVDTAKARGAGIRDRMQARMKATRDAAGHALQDGKAAAHHVADSAKSQGQSALAAAAKLHETNPMVTAALGIALGALLGTLVPQSRQEDKALGEVADKGLESVASVAKKASTMIGDKLSASDLPTEPTA